MASIIDAKHSCLTGTPEALTSFLRGVRSSSGIADLKYCKIYLLDKPLDNARIEELVAKEVARERLSKGK